MEDLAQLQTIWFVAIYTSLGYLFGLLVSGAGAITQGIRVLAHGGTIPRWLAVLLQLINAVVALTAVIVLPTIIGKLFEGKLSTLGSALMLGVCVVTILLLAKILVHLGLFRNDAK